MLTGTGHASLVRNWCLGWMRSLAVYHEPSASTENIPMSGLRLALHLSATFDEAVRLLSAALPENRLVLSGGSVLQALWGHRFSTDLDFFIPGPALSNQAGLMRDRMNIVARSVKAAGNPEPLRDADGMEGKINGVRFSVGVAKWMRVEFGRGFVQDTSVQAAGVEEIFIGKIHGRLRHGRRRDGRIPIRDLYDMSVCMGRCPDVLRHHFRQLKDDQVHIYARRLRSMPENWHELDEDSIIDPTYAIDLHGISQIVAEAVERRDASFIPVAEPPATRPNHDARNGRRQGNDRGAGP